MAAVDSDLTVVLLGKTGSGKSAAGNTILGREEFSVVLSSKSVTRKCEKHEGTVSGRKISVIDTPGLLHTSMSEDKLKAEIERCVYLSFPGPHVFLLVVRLGVRYTEEEQNAVEWIQKNFGEEASKHTIVLFTHADVLKAVSVEQYIADDELLKQLVENCEGRYHLFNNEDMQNRSQVLELLEKTDDLSSTYYTNEMYQAIQKKLEEEEEERKIKEEEESLNRWEKLSETVSRLKYKVKRELKRIEYQEKKNQKLSRMYKRIIMDVMRNKDREEKLNETEITAGLFGTLINAAKIAFREVEFAKTARDGFVVGCVLAIVEVTTGIRLLSAITPTVAFVLGAGIGLASVPISLYKRRLRGH